MSFRFTPHFIRRLYWSDGLAQAGRIPPYDTDRALIVSVAAVDDRILTTPTAALIAKLVNAVSENPVAIIDTDGMNQPVRAALGAHRGGDFFGLVNQSAHDLQREQVAAFVDCTGKVPTLAVSMSQPKPISPTDLQAVLPRIQHRWPTVIIDLPFTTSNELIFAGTELANHVVLLADKHTTDFSWLYHGDHALAHRAQAGAVTPILVGSTSKQALAASAVALPEVDTRTTAREEITVKTSPEALSMYHRFLSRLYPERKTRLTQSI